MRPALKRRKKIHCPVCHKAPPPAYSRSYPTTGMRVRYFRCPHCGARYKSVERYTLIRGD